MSFNFCSDCPPVGYSTNKTRCEGCPRGWPWLRIDGHLMAKIIKETAETVTIEYQHVAVPEWRGTAELGKPEFLQMYGSPNR